MSNQTLANQAAVIAPKPSLEPGPGWMMQEWDQSEPNGNDFPIHPHLHPTRPSRLHSDPRTVPLYNAVVAPSDTQVKSTLFNSTLKHYRISLYKLLDSERWDHAKTTNRLKSEISRRECAENEVRGLRKGWESLQFSLRSSSRTISELTSERFHLHQEITQLRDELGRRQALYEDLVFKHENDLDNVQAAFQQHIAESRGNSSDGENALQITVSPLDVIRA